MGLLEGTRGHRYRNRIGPRYETLVKALAECAGAIDDELSCCSAEEVSEHPILSGHREILQRARTVLASVRKAQGQQVAP